MRAVGEIEALAPLYLSPPGRGRTRSVRVRGLSIPEQRSRETDYDRTALSVDSIVSSTPSIFLYMSTFEKRMTRYPKLSRSRVRLSSRRIWSGSPCVTPSTSTTTLPSNVTKSTTYLSIGCCRRNFHRSNLRPRNRYQSFASALVCDARSARALFMNRSIPLTRTLRVRPLPGGERYSTTTASA